MIAASRIPLIAAAGGVVGQVAFVVDDMDAALRTWGSDAGHWRLWEYGPAMIDRQTYAGTPSTYSMILAMNGANPQLELVQPLTGPSIYTTWRDAGGVGVHHLGYYVDDLETVACQMVEAGFPIVQTGDGFGADGTGSFAYFDTRAAIGIYLEGIQVPLRRRDPERVWPEEVP